MTRVSSWFPALGKDTSFCLTNAPLNLLDNIAPTVLLMMQQKDWSFRGLTFILQQRKVEWVDFVANAPGDISVTPPSSVPAGVAYHHQLWSIPRDGSIHHLPSLKWFNTVADHKAPLDDSLSGEASSICNEVLLWEDHPQHLWACRYIWLTDAALACNTLFPSYSWRRSPQGYNLQRQCSGLS